MPRHASILLLIAALLAAVVVAEHAHYVDGEHNPLYEHQLDDEDRIVRARIESCSG